MTLDELKFIDDLKEEIKLAHDFVSMNTVVCKVKGYYNEKFDLKLYIFYKNTKETYNQEYCNYDKESILGYLNSILNSPNVSNALKTYELIKEGKKSEGPWNIKHFIEKVYSAYSGIISFDDNIKKLAMPKGPGQYGTNADVYMRDGVIIKLEQYANDILNSSIKNETSNPNIIVNNVINNDISIDVSVENAIEAVQDACLSDSQSAEVLQMIYEIKEILNSKESQKSKWEKIKGVFKWITEQGIQVAGIIVPLIAQMMGKM